MKGIRKARIYIKQEGNWKTPDLQIQKGSYKYKTGRLLQIQIRKGIRKAPINTRQEGDQ